MAPMSGRSLVQAPVAPMDVHGAQIFSVGTLVWAALGVWTLVRCDDPDWWAWTCLAGVLIGLVGVAYAIWRARS